MWLAPGRDHYEPISWDDAFALVARHADATSTDPDEAVFYTSGRTSNEAAFVYQLFVRAFGTNNLPDCSNMCHESSGAALTETIGVGKGSVTLDDVHQADLILVVGQNPGTNHPRMLTALERAKRNGARIIAVNPLPEAGLMRFAQPAAARGLVGRGTAAGRPVPAGPRQRRPGAVPGPQPPAASSATRPAPGAIDHAFVDAHCDGLDALGRRTCGGIDWAELLEATGLARDQIERGRRAGARRRRAPSSAGPWA